MKKLALLLVFILCSMNVFAAPSVPGLADGELGAELKLPVDDIKVSDIVYLTVDIDCEKPIYAFEAEIEYDEDKASFKEADIGKKTDVKIINDEKGKLMFALSSVGEGFLADNGKDFCTFSFKAKKSGKISFVLKSLTVIFDDMTYLEEDEIDEKVSLKIKSLSSGGASGGSSGGSSISISKPVTSTGSDIPKEPQISDSAQNKPDEVKKTYRDVAAEYWGYKYIEGLSSKGIINGYADGSFMPENPVTRAEFAKLICMTFGILNDGIPEVKFSDVTIGEWYYPYVATLSDMGVLKGEEGMFFPDREITREEAATVIKRCADYLKKEFKAVREDVAFADGEEVSDYAKESVDALCRAGIVNGNEDRMFMPKNNLSRAEASAMVYNILNLIGGDFL